MSDWELSRRRVLAGLAGAGGAGVLAGTGTSALLTREAGVVDNSVVTGQIDLDVAWETADASGSSRDGTPLTLAPTLGETERAEFTLSLPEGETNPAYGWVRTECVGSALAEELTVTLQYGHRASGETLATGSLAETDLVTGIPLDANRVANVDPGEQTCLQPGEELDLTLSVTLDGWAVDATRLALEFVGVQCRNTAGVDNPFGDVSLAACSEPTVERYGISHLDVFVTESGDCTRLATMELTDSYVSEGSYPIVTEDGTETGYTIEITETTTKDGGAETTGVAFRVTGPDGAEPTLCRVDVKGGPEEATYTDNTGALTGNRTNGVLKAPR